MAERHITDGQLAGWSLRVRAGGIQARPVGGEWSRAPLRLLAKHYDANSDVWGWLRAHGATRPSPSGSSVPDAQRSTVRVTVHLPPDAARALDELAKGATRSAVVAELLRAAQARR